MKSSICDVRKCAVSFWALSAAAIIVATVMTCSAAQAQAPDEVTSSASSLPSPGDWTQFHRDNMQRWNPYETVLGVKNVGSLQAKWKVPTGPYGNASAPAVVDGIVYFVASSSVYAVNAYTGAKLWSYDGARVVSSPAVANGVVYIGAGDIASFGGNVYALRADSGAKLWSYATGGVVNACTVANGVVYVSSDDHNVYALSASIGAKLWSFATGGFVDSSPAVANGVVHVSSSDGFLYALNASTGARLWSFTNGHAEVSSPAVANGVVYFNSNDGHIYALNAGTGAKLWSFAIERSVSSPAVANGVVYVGAGDRNVHALNASTGAKLWSSNIGDYTDSAPAVANGVVYISDDHANLNALNASTGDRLWSYNIGNGAGGFDHLSILYPSVSNGVVYVHGGEDYLGHSNVFAFSVGADLFLRVQPSATTVHQGDLLTYVFPVWNLGPANADFEVLNTQVPAGTILEYTRISGTPGLGTCTTPRYHGTGQIICHENSSMAPNTTWTVRVTVKVTASAGSTITENAATLADSLDPNLANNVATATVAVH